MKRLPRAIFLMGPTASGKTGVAVELVERLPLEIISVDSALVYRDMNIGTAKPDAATLARAPHHLIDIVDPTAAYSAAAFRKDALHLMDEIARRGKIPLLVGGTMLYFKALKEGLSDLPVADPEIRKELDEIIRQKGTPHLHTMLSSVDPTTAERLSPNDTQRIGRAMEIFRITGTPMSELLNKQRGESLPFDVLSIALIPGNRSALHQRIALRFSQMLEQGLIGELEGLREKYRLHRDLPSMRCVGYRQAWEYLEGEIDRVAFLEKGIIATRQLAKRQLTWLRSMPGNIEIDCLEKHLSERVGRAINL